ncbi:MAG: tetraacyldisaccharide 4'-kinase [Pyrinomonadaceae bacterium]
MSSLSRLALAPLTAAYGGAVRARLALYRRGALPQHRLAVPVLSVGNLTAGGTGKTPLVERLARAVAGREGKRVCVLTRGYGREDARRRVVVSDGKSVLAEARAAGDEPLLLAERLLDVGVAVVCDADRVAAARFALEKFGSEVFILDDGFQHLRVTRDMNIVTLDATDPWGGGRLLPAGMLREPVAGLSRADCVVITRVELAKDSDALRAEASRLTSGRPVFAANTRLVGVKLISQSVSETATQGEPPRVVAAFCGVGNPRAFFANLRGGGYELRRTRAFADHHDYTQGDVEETEREAQAAGATALVTTAKDAIKLRALRFGMPCYEIEIELEIDDEPGFMELVRAAIAEGDKKGSIA